MPNYALPNYWGTYDTSLVVATTGDQYVNQFRLGHQPAALSTSLHRPRCQPSAWWTPNLLKPSVGLSVSWSVLNWSCDVLCCRFWQLSSSCPDSLDDTVTALTRSLAHCRLFLICLFLLSQTLPNALPVAYWAAPICYISSSKSSYVCHCN